jgi:exodeoxyribonuclease-5
LITLTEEQKNAVDTICDIANTSSLAIFGGAAGAGKSTCLTHISQIYPNYAIACFTGKAANVLQKKGLPEAQTIHSLIYKVKPDHKGNPKFVLKQRYELDCNGFLLDEASMIGQDLFDDLLSFNLPIICFGDHAQLEPIGSKFNLMAKPDVKLETIHRNANNIAKFAHFIRMGESPINYKHFDDQVQICSKKTASVEKLSQYEQVICGYNKTRLSLNSNMRKHLKLTGLLAKGEKIICLKNNRNLKIFNGMQGYVHKITKNNKIIFFTNGKNIALDIELLQFGKDKVLESANDNPDLGYFDYAYTITCHKAQGDEWTSVAVLDESQCKIWDPSRWAYTAATRAKEKLLWCL